MHRDDAAVIAVVAATLRLLVWAIGAPGRSGRLGQRGGLYCEAAGPNARVNRVLVNHNQYCSSNVYAVAVRQSPPLPPAPIGSSRLYDLPSSSHTLKTPI